jgi:ribonuclease P protein component
VDRQHRVRKRDDFARIRSEGRRLANPLLRIQWAPNALAMTRFGFIVSKRVAVRAHERNLVRRRLRELARAELAALAPGYDILLQAQPPARAAGYRELDVALRHLLQRARLRRPAFADGPPDDPSRR